MASERKRIRPGWTSMDLGRFKPSWLAWCESVGERPGEALRRIVRGLRPGKWPAGAVLVPAVRPKSSRSSAAIAVRLKLPLTADEHQAVLRAAEHDGLPAPRWIITLIRGNVFERPQLTSQAVEALRVSNLQVQAVGRNLNQLVRALNSIVDHLDHGRLKEAGAALREQRGQYVGEQVKEIRELIQRHMPLVTDALAENVGRWRRAMPSAERAGKE